MPTTHKFQISTVLAIYLAFLASALLCVFLSPPDQFNSVFSVATALSTSLGDPGDIFVGVSYLAVDSGYYIDAARSFTFPQFQISDAGLLSAITSLLSQTQNVSLFYIVRAADATAVINTYVFVAIVNHVFFLIAVLNYWIIARLLAVDGNQLMRYIAANMILFFMLYSVNKEAIGFLLISEIALFWVRPNFFRFLFVLLIALFTRHLFLVFALLVFADRIFRLRPLLVLLFVSGVVIPVAFIATGGALMGEEFGNLADAVEIFEQQSMRFTTAAFEFAQYPFGYLITYVAMLSVNVAGPFLNPSYWRSYTEVINLSQLFLQLSSGLFIYLLMRIGFAGRLLVQLDGPLRLVLYYTMISCILPISQHRYLLPIYPCVVIAYLHIRRASETQTKLVRETGVRPMLSGGHSSGN